jgi:hypothetical protein
MELASLMAYPGKDLGHGHLKRLLIVTDDAANSIAQRFDGLKQVRLQGLVPRRQ